MPVTVRVQTYYRTTNFAGWSALEEKSSRWRKEGISTMNSGGA